MSEGPQEAIRQGRGGSADLERRVAVAQELFRRVEMSYVYRLMRRLGLWSWLEQGILAVVQHGPAAMAAAPQRSGKLERILVDLTPILPGGENGGAKPLAMELVENMAKLAPECEFVLLTHARTHDELSVLDAPNLSRLCVIGDSTGADSPADEKNSQPGIARRLAAMAARNLPSQLADRLVEAYREILSGPENSSLPSKLEADLVFFPFTAPQFYDPTVPAVCSVNDLQYLYYPQFFDPSERAARDRHFRDAVRGAARLTCLSEHVRQTVIEHGRVPPERAVAVHVSLRSRVRMPSAEAKRRVLGSLGLEEDGYLFYPANFWRHKNHEMLLTAFGIYLARHPDNALKLVCTGAPGPRRDEMLEVALRMGLEQSVVLPGFVSGNDFSAILYCCRAVVFPSLYEGFGIPVLEAMAAGKPVLASNVTSLPEVAADAALLFDPRKPEDLAGAICTLVSDPDLRRSLVVKGLARAAEIGEPENMAARYLEVFRAAVQAPAIFRTSLHGVYTDGWTGERVVATFGGGPAGRSLEIVLQSPPWQGEEPIRLDVTTKGAPVQYRFLWRGESVVLASVLPDSAGYMAIGIAPAYQPSSHGSPDVRRLGCRFVSGKLVDADGKVERLETAPV